MVFEKKRADFPISNFRWLQLNFRWQTSNGPTELFTEPIPGRFYRVSGNFQNLSWIFENLMWISLILVFFVSETSNWPFSMLRRSWAGGLDSLKDLSSNFHFIFENLMWISPILVFSLFKLQIDRSPSLEGIERMDWTRGEISASSFLSISLFFRKSDVDFYYRYFGLFSFQSFIFETHEELNGWIESAIS